MKIFIIDNIESPWGDYGDILLSGMAFEENGVTYIERNGPFVPSITISGLAHIIVTDNFKILIENENFKGISFEKANKRKIVELHWDKWDNSRDEPQEYPETGEPEDYIDLGEHSEEISFIIGDLWRMKVINCGKTDRDPKRQFPNDDIWLMKDSIPNYDFFMPDGVLWNCISERVKKWLEFNSNNLLTFKEIKIK